MAEYGVDRNILRDNHKRVEAMYRAGEQIRKIASVFKVDEDAVKNYARFFDNSVRRARDEARYPCTAIIKKHYEDVLFMLSHDFSLKYIANEIGVSHMSLKNYLFRLRRDGITINRRIERVALRDKQILDMLSKGKTSAEISDELDIELRTIYRAVGRHRASV